MRLWHLDLLLTFAFASLAAIYLASYPVIFLDSRGEELARYTLTAHALDLHPYRLLLKPGTGRDKRGISRPVPPTKTRDGIEFYCKRIRRKQRKGSRLLEHGTELLGVTTSAAAGQVCCW